ncbi:hypothetical protein T484DRAFT_1958324 [Baffinella frigidus]|nr:hypothetical protein T484DRAFT_1958324 [Cryptophyta sp. CCMP2293]
MLMKPSGVGRCLRRVCGSRRAGTRSRLGLQTGESRCGSSLESWARGLARRRWSRGVASRARGALPAGRRPR